MGVSKSEGMVSIEAELTSHRKVRHQHMRHFLWQPAKAIVYDIFGMSQRSYIAHGLAVMLAFLFSGIMHRTAHIATKSKVSMARVGRFEVFCFASLWGPIRRGRNETVHSCLGQENNIRRAVIDDGQDVWICLGSCIPDLDGTGMDISSSSEAASRR